MIESPEPSWSRCAGDAAALLRPKLRRIEAVVTRPWYSYAVLLILQLSVMWGIWCNRDVTGGDTASYFKNGRTWWETGVVEAIHFSPLYSCYYGLIYGLTQDPISASWLHRFVLVLAVSTLVLAFLRRLLPPLLALLIAAWWAILPINFNTLYEVHLFAVLPILCAWLFTLLPARRWGRGCALAMLLLTTLLMRNEMSIATLLFGAAVLVWEWKTVGWRGLFGWRTWLPYGAPVLAVVLLTLAAWSRVPENFPFQIATSRKHTVNMGQVYAVGWQQRHPEWTHSPWLEYGPLMQEHFGASEVSLRDMIAANPSAVLEHFLWNLSLTPGGLQVLLFNAMSGSRNPDYAPVHQGQWWPQILFVGLIVVIALGARRAWRERERLWPEFFQPRAATWLIMFSTAVVSIPVILTQRPRPSYLFSLELVLMTLLGASLYLLRDRRVQSPARQVLVYLALLVLAVFAPSQFDQPLKGPNTLTGMLRKLAPYEELISRPQTIFVKGAHAGETRLYLGRDLSAIHPYSVLGEDLTQINLVHKLSDLHATLFYLDHNLLHRLEAAGQPNCPFISRTPAGWKLIGCGEAPGDRWRLFERVPPQMAQSSQLLR